MSISKPSVGMNIISNDGRISIEVPSYGIYAERNIGNLKVSPEFSLKGSSFLYFLIGKDSEGLKKVYVGQTNNYSRRLVEHMKPSNVLRKDWATESIVFTGSWSAADLNGLEYRFIQSIIETFEGTGVSVENSSPGRIDYDNISPVSKVLIDTHFDVVSDILQLTPVNIKSSIAL